MPSMRRAVSRTTVQLCAGSIAAVAFASVPGALSATEVPPITVGVVTYLSGPFAPAFGAPVRHAAELVADALNSGAVPAPYAITGIGGAPLMLKFVDEAGGIERQVDAYRKLVANGSVDLVVGYVSSRNCEAIAPLAEQMKRLTVFFDCGAPKIFEEADHRYLFRTGATTTMDNTAAALYLTETKRGVRSVAGLNHDQPWGRNSWDTFQAALKSLVPRVQVVAATRPESAERDYEAEISIVRNADVVHTSLWGQQAEAFVLQGSSRELFRRSTVVMTAGEPSIERLGAQVPDGTIVGARGPFGVFAPDTVLHRWFRNAYRERYGVAPSYPAYKMAQALLGVKSAWEKAQAVNHGARPSQEETIGAFEHLRFEGPAGPVEMTIGKGHQAVQDTSYGTVRHFRDKTSVVDVRRYAAARTTPPDGVKSDDWIRSQFTAR